MSHKNSHRDCKCGLLEKLAAIPSFPVRYDFLLREFGIRHGDNTWCPMRYCFSCGGELPESARAEMFTTPSAEEMDAVALITANVSTMEDARRVLGPPDETIPLVAFDD